MKKTKVSISTLINNRVFNHEDNEVGYLKDVVIDLETGTIIYCVLSFGGIYGTSLAEKLLPVPLSKFTIDRNTHTLRVHIPEKELEAAPGLNKQHLSDTL